MLTELKYIFQNEDDWILDNCEFDAHGLTIIDRSLPARAEYKVTHRAFDLRSIQFKIHNTTTDSVFYTVLVNGVEYYYNGFDWTVSTGGLLEKNLFDDVVPFHKALKNVCDFGIVIYMSGMVGTLPEDFSILESIHVTIDLKGIEPEQPQMCRVFGYIKGMDNKPLEGAIVIIRLDENPKYYTEASDRLIVDTLMLKTDKDGMWTTDLLPSSFYEGTPAVYTLEYIYKGAQKTHLDRKNKTTFSVPVSKEENITNLIVRP